MVFHDPEELTGELAELGWSADIRTREEFFVGIAEVRSTTVAQPRFGSGPVHDPPGGTRP
ncbi:hypothetical protein GCM10010306_070990 [Streptomyces umbrinus]|nr:hypothetical protein GCM10010306_070990 [Streptomyces umbrinus]GHH50992.1 hypothetical protein GCM10018775_48980 [Streptomyces umbrinus]